MARAKHTTEQIVNKLRQADVELSKGQSISAVCKQIGITDQTYYRCLTMSESVAGIPQLISATLRF